MSRIVVSLDREYPFAAADLPKIVNLGKTLRLDDVGFTQDLLGWVLDPSSTYDVCDSRNRGLYSYKA